MASYCPTPSRLPRTRLGVLYLQQTVRRSTDAVKGGSTLAAALARGSAFPAVALELVRVGEEGGRLVEMLDRLATEQCHRNRNGNQTVCRHS